ncbi:MAG: Fe-S oxidoreductase, partial [Chitinophagaceae bacterium]
MEYIPQILFVLIAGFAIWLFATNMLQIRKNILLGLDEDLSDNKSLRWKNLLLLAFGQKKMFRNPLVAVLHFIIYAGFIIINIE